MLRNIPPFCTKHPADRQ